MTNERKTVTQAYESLSAASTALFGTITNFAAVVPDADAVRIVFQLYRIAVAKRSGGAGQCPPKS